MGVNFLSNFREDLLGASRACRVEVNERRGNGASQLVCSAAEIAAISEMPETLAFRCGVCARGRSFLKSIKNK